MENTVVVMQSNYIPWRGYFELISKADTFIIYDEVQYTKNDWRNRNKIKTNDGPIWLTIPIQHKKLSQSIDETKIADRRWRAKHSKAIAQHYRKANNYNSLFPVLDELFDGARSDYLSEVNLHFIRAMMQLLRIKTPIINSREFTLTGSASERLLQICKNLNATKYLSGPAAKQYLDTDLFAAESINVEWMNYGHYAEYPQLYPPFEPHVSVIDMLFNIEPAECSSFFDGSIDS